MTNHNSAVENWADNAEVYGNIIAKELQCFKKDAWTKLILDNAPKLPCLNILDVGTGPGFFAIILTEAGHKVTAVDSTEAMLTQARQNAAEYHAFPDFQLQDIHSMTFSDESFDLIVSRNVTWTLLDAEKAYSEWSRLLKPGGRILIFDSNWNLRFFDERFAAAYREDEAAYYALTGKKVHQDPDEEKMNAYRKSVPMSARLRPQWDLMTMLNLGFRHIECDTDITELVWDDEEKIKYRSRPMFMICADKIPT